MPEMLKFNRKHIVSAIDILDEELNRVNFRGHVYLIIVGAASLILKFNLKRATADIDVMEQISQHPQIHGGLGSMLSRMGFHIVSEVMINLHPDYSERLDHFESKGMIDVFTLNPHDLAISKIARGFRKDIDDILDSDLLADIDITRLKTAYFQAVDYWIGGDEKYRMNWDLFYESFTEKKGRTGVGF